MFLQDCAEKWWTDSLLESCWFSRIVNEFVFGQSSLSDVSSLAFFHGSLLHFSPNRWRYWFGFF